MPFGDKAAIRHLAFDPAPQHLRQHPLDQVRRRGRHAQASRHRRDGVPRGQRALPRVRLGRASPAISSTRHRGWSTRWSAIIPQGVKLFGWLAGLRPSSTTRTANSSRRSTSGGSSTTTRPTAASTASRSTSSSTSERTRGRDRRSSAGSRRHRPRTTAPRSAARAAAWASSRAPVSPCRRGSWSARRPSSASSRRSSASAPVRARVAALRAGRSRRPSRACSQRTARARRAARRCRRDAGRRTRRGACRAVRARGRGCTWRCAPRRPPKMPATRASRACRTRICGSAMRQRMLRIACATAGPACIRWNPSAIAAIAAIAEAERRHGGGGAAMVDARAAGVMFTRSPDHRRSLGGHHRRRLGPGLRGGGRRGDAGSLGDGQDHRRDLRARHIATNTSSIAARASGGIETVAVADERRRAPCLSDDELQSSCGRSRARSSVTTAARRTSSGPSTRERRAAAAAEPPRDRLVGEGCTRRRRAPRQIRCRMCMSIFGGRR